MTHEQIEEVAQMAAQMYGQEWVQLSMWSKDIWRESVRHDHAVVTSEAQRCAAEAKNIWLHRQKAQAEPEVVQPVEKKSKNKK